MVPDLRIRRQSRCRDLEALELKRKTPAEASGCPKLAFCGSFLCYGKFSRGPVPSGWEQDPILGADRRLDPVSGGQVHGPGEGLFPQVPIIRPEGYKDRAAPEGDLLHSEKISSRPVRLQASGPEHQPAGAVGNRRARHWSISREGDGLGDEFLGEEGNWTIKSTAGEPSPGNGSVYIHAVPEIIGSQSAFRPEEYLLWRHGLDQTAAKHQGDPVGHRQGLLPVMGHQDHGHMEFPL